MKKILLAIDGSACSTAAADLLNKLPLTPDCHVTVLTVLEDFRAPFFDSGFGADFPMNLDRTDLRELEAQRNMNATHVLEAGVKRLNNRSWSVDTLIRRDEAASGIIKAAGELDADLIVIGSHGLGRVERFLIGSVSRRVVAHAPCSVLVVRQPKKPVAEQPLRVLVALDGSQPAKAALDAVADMAKQGPLQATLMRVLLSSHFYRIDILEQMTDSWQNLKQEAKEQIQAAGDALRRTGADVSIEFRDGHNVSEELLAVAKKNGTDILVVGHRSHNAFEHFLLGSVSRRVLCHAGCSVWIHRDKNTNTQ